MWLTQQLIVAHMVQVDLPEDPAIAEMLKHRPAYGSVTTPKEGSAPKSTTPKAITPKGPEGGQSMTLVVSACLWLFWVDLSCSVPVVDLSG